MFLDPSCRLDKKKIWWNNSNVPAIFLHYPHHLQTPSLIIHEEYLYGDISLHFSYHPPCSANRDTKVYFRSQREWFHKSQSSLSVGLFFLAESNYKMPQLPILSQEWVIRAWPLLSPSSSGDWRITKRLTCALHYHHISWMLKLQDGNVIGVFLLCRFLLLLSFLTLAPLGPAGPEAPLSPAGPC